MRRFTLLLLALAGCRSLFGLEDPVETHDALIPDDTRAIDAALPPWGTPVPVFVPATGFDDDDPTLTDDMLELYFNRSSDIYVATRASVSDPFGAPTIVSELSTASAETTPEIDGTGFSMFFASDISPSAMVDIWVTTRTMRGTPWLAPQQAGGLSSPLADTAGGITADRLTVTLASNRAGADVDLYITTRASPSAAFPAPTAIASVNAAVDDYSPFLSPDGQTLYFDSARSTGRGGTDLYVSERDASGAFSAPQLIDELDTQLDENDPWVSPDGRTIFFMSNREGRSQLYTATR